MLGCTPYSDRHTSTKLAEYVVVRLHLSVRLPPGNLVYSRLMQALVDKWNVSHLLDVITTDRASNMVGMWSQSEFPTTYSSGVCFNHILQRIVEVGKINNYLLSGKTFRENCFHLCID